MRADVFCKVIDNLGDIGVIWRLVRELASQHDWQIRLWVDDLATFNKLQPAIDPSQQRQRIQNIEIHRWPSTWISVDPYRVVIAGFSCDLPDAFIRAMAQQPNPVWIQLEYLSAESWVESFHGQQSLRDDKLRPVFFFPGFSAGTGGLILERSLLERRDQWLSDRDMRESWLIQLGVRHHKDAKLVSMFTYEHAPVDALLRQLGSVPGQFHLLFPSGSQIPKDSQAIENVVCQSIPFLEQSQYDQLLWSCDLNFVRGEDSLVRAIWAGKPLFWQIYRQADGVHHNKLAAWLKLANLPAPLETAMHQWSDGQLTTTLAAWLDSDGWRSWQLASKRFSDQLVRQPSLTDKLAQWCQATP